MDPGFKKTESAPLLNVIRFPDRHPTGFCKSEPASSEISDLCEISDWLLFVSYFASQSKGIKFGDYFFDVYCWNKTLWLNVRYPQQAIVRE